MGEEVNECGRLRYHINLIMYAPIDVKSFLKRIRWIGLSLLLRS
jgi:hypothetical protein